MKVNTIISNKKKIIYPILLSDRKEFGIDTKKIRNILWGKIFLLFPIIFFFSFGCGSLFGQNAEDEKKVSSCILLGNDSIAYYYGSSDKMKELLKGNINDSVFLSQIIKSIKKHYTEEKFKVSFKPTTGGDIEKSVITIINLFNTNNIDNRYLDSLDENEKQFFNTETNPGVVVDLNRKSLKLSLVFPETNNDSLQNSAKSESTVTMILYDENSIYIYEGENLSNGKKYSYSDIDNYIKQRVSKFSKKDLEIIIVPTDNTTYANTIDILDKVTSNNIDKYTLVELSKEEKAFIKNLKK